MIERRSPGAAPIRSAAWTLLRLLLAPVIFLGRGPLRLLLASVAGIATVAAFACLFSIRLALDTGSGLWEPILSAYGMAAVAAVSWWLRARVPLMFERDHY